MRPTTYLIAFGVALVGALTPVAATAAPANLAQSHSIVVASHHACTRTSSGSCIRGGEFCPRAKYRHSGWDARGHRYVCKGSHTHPHWMKP